MSAMLKRDEQNTFIIQTAIRRWGNSQGIRSPKELMDKVNLKENDEINITIDSGKIIIEKINKPKYLNLQERLEKFYGKPIDEIYVESTQEVDIGTPKGKEIW